MNKKKKQITILISIITILVIGFILLIKGFIKLDLADEKVISNEVDESVDVIQEGRGIWLDNKKFNDDYVGQIVFDSDLINQPFVQAKNTIDADGNLYHFYNENGSLVTDPSGYNGNDVYIYTDWKDMSYDFTENGGSIFMDYRNELDDQNIIIYGHHFSIGGGNDKKRVKAFTPLEKLLEEENYKDNDTLSLILDNETRYYELVSVYIYDISNQFYEENMQYYRPTYNYDDFTDITNNDYYQKYISYLDTVELYDTGIELTTKDKTLTLQTCIGGKPNERQICVFKLVDSVIYDE